MTAKTAADLRAAADVLRRDGWTQGKFHDAETGCHCAAGALEVATAADISGRWLDSVRALSAQLRITPGPISVYRWNDDPGRTADEVLAALEAAAEAEEREAAYDEGRWCGECQYGVAMNPPCCTQGPDTPQSGDRP
jgi:hypothetical protein